MANITSCIHTRRGFLKSGMAAVLGSYRLSAQNADSARKLRIAAIGVGGMGSANLTNLAGEDIVAICDVDHAYAAPMFAKFPRARRWRDYREMISRQDDIEAVLIATPDHNVRLKLQLPSNSHKPDPSHGVHAMPFFPAQHPIRKRGASDDTEAAVARLFRSRRGSRLGHVTNARVGL